MFQNPGWLLISGGLLIVLLGILWLWSPAIPWLGRLPGDVVIERGNSTFYFPITTCILLSLMLTGFMWSIRFLPVNDKQAAMAAIESSSEKPALIDLKAEDIPSQQ